MKLGATYSHREIRNMGLSHEKAWPEALDIGFAVLRLAAYWDEIEPSEGEFNIDPLLAMLEDCNRRNQKVVMVVGMKAPRWPEYYVPKWLSIDSPEKAEKQVLNLIGRVVEALKGFECIVAWQVENEPLDGSGPNSWQIPARLLAKEVTLVRKLDPERQIQLTVWGNSLSRNGYMPDLALMADVVGLDIYYQTPVGVNKWLKKIGWMKPSYAGPFDSQRHLRHMIALSTKPVWISELQVEAWEEHDAGKWQERPGSMSGQILQKNVEQARELGVEMILLWGIEYWYWQKERGRMELWETGRGLVK